jgi:hypothetical protein
MRGIESGFSLNNFLNPLHLLFYRLRGTFFAIEYGALKDEPHCFFFHLIETDSVQ